VSGYKVARIDEIEELDDGRQPMRPLRHHLGITAFGINSWTAKNAGDRIINEHDEADDGHEELYVVTEGHARFELDGEQLDAPAGTLVFVRPGVRRTAFAEEASTTLIAVGGEPGKPYEVMGWELWAPVRKLYAAGDYAAAVDRGREVVEANPEYPASLYNLACCESLAGLPADAIEHLRRAIELLPRAREFARGDSDFDSIRDEPAFRALVDG
jgi:tetratricopeptide (TPR) repeat protein